MRVTVEMTRVGLDEMGVTAEQLEDAVRYGLSNLEVEGDVVYIDKVDVAVEISDDSSGMASSNL